MTNFDIIIALIIVALSIIMPIYYSRKRKKEQHSEAMERMLIRDYGRKINEQTRNKRKFEKKI